MTRHSAGQNPYVPRQITLARPRTNVDISTITVCGSISGATDLQDIMPTDDIPSTTYPYETTGLHGKSILRLTDSNPQRYKLTGESIGAVETAHKKFLEYVLLAGGDAQRTASRAVVHEVSGIRDVSTTQYQTLNQMATKNVDPPGLVHELNNSRSSGSRVEALIRVAIPTPNADVSLATYSDGTQIFTGAQSIRALDAAVERFDFWLKRQ